MFFILLLLSSSLESIIIHWVSLNQSIKPYTEQLIILSELCKILISIPLFYLTSSHNDYPIVLSNIYAFIIPAFIYTISNNIIFLALQILTPNMFTLLSNMKIPITIILATLLLKHNLNRYRVLTVIFIFIGNTIACYNWGNNTVIPLLGITYMLIYSLCSGSAAVYTEYIMKIKYNNENIFIQNIKFCTMSILCNLVIMIYNGHYNSFPLEPVHLMSVGSMAINGINTSLVIKFSGSIAKTYATSLAVLVTSILSYIIWDVIITFSFIFGSITTFLGINIYVYDKYYDELNKYYIELNKYYIRIGYEPINIEENIEENTE